MSKSKSNSAIILPNSNTGSQGFIQLPFNEEGFKEFVTGLLGKPQTINGTISGTFDLETKDVSHIFATIEQRINQQNDAHLIQFSARIIFEDNSSVLVNSYPEFVSYNEIRNIVSNELHLTFLYLIKFRDKNVPEKQEINISFIANGKRSQAQKFINASSVRVGEDEKNLIERVGIIQYEIKHTARTWATDLAALMTNSFEAIIQEESKIRIILKKYFFQIAFVLAGFSGFVVYCVNERARELVEAERIKQIEQIFNKKNVSLPAINEKLKYLAIHNNPEEDIPFGTVMPYVTFFMFLIIYSVILDTNYKKSFILLTQASYKKKEVAEVKYRNRTIIVIGTMIINIILGVLSSFVFEFIK